MVLLHGSEVVIGRDAWRRREERRAAAAPALAEHTRDRGDECDCTTCAADHLDVPPLRAALWLAVDAGDLALVARIRAAYRLAKRRRRA
jgi:hypothetical protein